MIVVGVSQALSVNYALKGEGVPSASIQGSGIIITQKSARTIYNSRVPITIADAINKMQQGSQAYAETITLADANGVPLVVRGLPSHEISSQGLDFPTGSNESSNLAIVGSEAQARLNAHVGARLSITSSFASQPINLTIAGFFATGTEEDYEVIVMIGNGEEVAGLPGGIANAVVIPGSSSFDLKTVGSEYDLKIAYQGVPGTLMIVDSAGFVHSSFQISASNPSSSYTFNASLPFGLYDAILEQNGVRTDLNQFVPNGNGSTIDINSTRAVGSAFLDVKVNTSSVTPPELLDSSNHTVPSQYFDQVAQAWVYKVNLGTYRLVLNGSSHEILVFGNTTFDSSAPSPNALLTVHVNTLGLSPQPVGYSITIEDIQSSRILYSSSSSDSILNIPIESGHTYTVAILTTQSLFLEQNVSIEKTNASVIFDVPYVPSQLQNAPVTNSGVLGLGFPSGSASFNYFFGTAIASTIALFSVMVALLVVTLFVLNSQLLASLRNEIRAIVYMFPKKSSFFWKIRAPILVLNLGGAAAGIALSFIAFIFLQMDSHVTFAGFGLVSYPMIYVAPVLVLLSLLSWVSVSLSMDVAVYGEEI